MQDATGPVEEAGPVPVGAIVPLALRARVLASLMRQVDEGNMAAAELLLRLSVPADRRLTPAPRDPSDGVRLASPHAELRAEVEAAVVEAVQSGVPFRAADLVEQFTDRGASRASLFRWIADAGGG